MTHPDPGGQGQTPQPVVIALDLLGGDAGPEVVADAALAVLQRTSDVDLVLVGPASTVAPLAQNRGLLDRKSTRLNSSHVSESRMPSSA